MRILVRARLLTTIAVLLTAIACVSAAAAAANDFVALLDGLKAKSFDDKARAVEALAATGDAAVVPVLQTLGDGQLYERKSDGLMVKAVRTDDGLALSDPFTGEALGTVGKRAAKKIKVNNKLRRVIRDAIGALTLLSPDVETRYSAADALFKSRDPAALDRLDLALAEEMNDTVRQAMAEARAAIVLASNADDASQIEAVSILAARGDQDALAVLAGVSEESSEAVREAAAAATAKIEQSLALWSAGQNIWYGLSLGSVLLLAAIGLAITFGVMGVINMAHGEMVMLGAYTTFVVQEVIRNSAPGLFDISLLIALPLAFVVAGSVGIAIERGIIRHLYGRPLETLLATWGLSLVLQQFVRTVFGPTNREVGNPSWMSGAFELGQLTITYNRLWILLFALLVLALLTLVLRKTSLGLQIRAVTQNRRMAGAMGIRTNWIDAITFGLGSGIAGIAGVALSQIDNVSPNLGQSYIIDSFMVVVFGGVGNLWGTLVGAMSLGVINKFLEPYAGAVLGKILVLVLIILFIQKRPRGLFALRGRAVET